MPSPDHELDDLTLTELHAIGQRVMAVAPEAALRRSAALGVVLAALIDNAGAVPERVRELPIATLAEAVNFVLAVLDDAELLAEVATQ